MIALIIVAPWVLTVIALLFIMVRNRQQGNFDEDDFIVEEENSEVVRVAVYDEKAYWVYQNVFYESEVTREPDFETARPIDVSSMPQKELKKLFAILDELQAENERE